MNSLFYIYAVKMTIVCSKPVMLDGTLVPLVAWQQNTLDSPEHAKIVHRVISDKIKKRNMKTIHTSADFGFCRLDFVIRLQFKKFGSPLQSSYLYRLPLNSIESL